ncbi:unnamed protein product [Sympodiomycopsis kandeliae]
MFSGLSRLVNSGATRGQETATSVLNSARGGTSRKRVISQALSDPYAAFVRDWDVLLGHLTAPDQAALHHGISRTDIPERMERLSMALISESTNIDEALDGIGPCMEHLLKRDVLSILVSSAIANRPAGVLTEAVKFYQVLIANLDARFLSQQAVNKPLVRLMRYCVGDEDVDSAWGREEGFEYSDGERDRARMTPEESANLDEALVGLMAFVASKLHNAQELLHIFFHDRHRDIGYTSPKRTTASADRPASPTGSSSSTATLKAAPKPDTESNNDNQAEEPEKSYDFPLFIYLLRFVHAEGQTGSLARAGLSVIVKIAFENKRGDKQQSSLSERRVRFTEEASDDSATLDLAEYILNSDFVVVIGASLGAVYGLLPSKLAILPPKQSDQTMLQEQHSAQMVSGGMSLGASSDHAFEAELERLQRLNIEPSTNPQITDRLLLFVDILEFVQKDVLARAKEGTTSSLGPKSFIAHQLITRLAHSIRLSLMTNILYPSMVESGDRDGSAVAVMTYLEVLLSVLDDRSPLADDIVGWLIRQEEEEEEQPSTTPSQQFPDSPFTPSGQRHKSAALLLLEQDKQAKRDEIFSDPLLHYTIKNLISDHIASTTSHATVAAALGIARAFLSRHGRFAPFGLIDVIPDDKATCFPLYLPPLYSDKGPSDDEEEEDNFRYPGSLSEELAQVVQNEDTTMQPTVGLTQHLREIDLYFSLITILEGRDVRNNAKKDKENHIDPIQADGGLASSTGYENYLQDAEEALLSNGAYVYGMENGLTLAPAKSISLHGNGQRRAHDGELNYPPFRHRLNPTDTLLRSVIARLRRFFEQPPELNVALTSLIYCISLNPYLSLEGWLTFERGEVNMDTEEGEESEDWRRGPSSIPQQQPLHSAVRPIILELLRILVNHVQNYRSQIPDFDRFLAERRKGLLFVENLNDALGHFNSTFDDEEESSGLLKPSISVPSTKASSSDRAWSLAGWTEKERQEEIVGDVQIVDVRDVKLPPRPSDDVDTSLEEEDSSRGASGSNKAPDPSSLFTLSRLFGRSSRNRSKADEPSKVNAADVSESKTEYQQPMPFADHYAQTAAISLEPSFVAMPNGPWKGNSGKPFKESKENDTSVATSGKKKKQTRFQLNISSPTSSPSTATSDDDEKEDTSQDSTISYTYPGQEDDENEELKRNRGRVTLSCLLDNVVILEEFVKELTAVIQVRRSIGIDLVGLVTHQENRK